METSDQQYMFCFFWLLIVEVLVPRLFPNESKFGGQVLPYEIPPCVVGLCLC